MPGDVALGPGAVGAFDGVDAEGQVAAPMEDACIDDPLREVVGGLRAVVPR